jgi:hypothetical protein
MVSGEKAQRTIRFPTPIRRHARTPIPFPLACHMQKLGQQIEKDIGEADVSERKEFLHVERQRLVKQVPGNLETQQTNNLLLL